MDQDSAKATFTANEFTGKSFQLSQYPVERISRLFAVMDMAAPRNKMA